MKWVNDDLKYAFECFFFSLPIFYFCFVYFFVYFKTNFFKSIVPKDIYVLKLIQKTEKGENFVQI